MSSNPSPINLLIADDHQMITEGLTLMLRSEMKVGQIHIAKNGKEAEQIALRESISIIIMDINMPIMNGTEATQLIKHERPDIKVIVVSMLAEPAIVNRLLESGADAFINKDAGKAELMTAIDMVMQGKKYVSPDISIAMFKHLNERVNDTNEKKQLTKREIEIIGHIANGLTNNEIAEKLFLSRVTIDTHRKNILAKLRLKNTATLVRYAIENKLL